MPVAPLPADTLLHFLLGLVVLLALARVLGLLAERLGLAAIVGELLTGVLLGPSLLGWIAPGVAGFLLPAEPEQMHLLDGVGQLGLLLLVALTGTHLDLGSVRRQSRAAITVSLGGLLLPLGFGIALGFPLAGTLAADRTAAPAVFSLFLGVSMCVTAIPVIAKTLSDLGLLHRTVGQLTLAGGMIDGAVGWLLLSVVSAAATVGVSTGQVALSVAYLIGFLVAAALSGAPSSAG